MFNEKIAINRLLGKKYDIYKRNDRQKSIKY